MPLFEARSTEDLIPICDSFIQQFQHGGIFLLHGEMGAGKTTFVASLCRALGADVASSPTFSLVNEYHTAQGKRIYHFDLYRIRSLEEALDFGFEEYLIGSGYVFIEWPDKVMDLIGDEAVSIYIRDEGTHRSISW